MSRDRKQNLDALFIAVIDGYATEAQFAECNRILAEDPEARLRYLQYVNVHASLLADLAVGADLQQLVDLSPASEGDTRKPALRITAWHWLVAAAAVLAIGLFVLTRPGPGPVDTDIASPSDQPTAPNAPATTMVHAAWGAEWSNDMLPLAAGDTLPVDRRLHLRSGIVQLRIDRVDVHIQAPAVFTFRADGSVDLELGMLVGHAKDAHSGFTVHLPTTDVVDLATIFGIHAMGTGEQEVHVFRGHGSIEKPTGKGVIESLVSGDAIHLDGDGTARPALANAEQFRAILPAEALSSDEVAKPPPVAAEQEVPHRQIGEWSRSILADKPDTLIWDISDYVVDGYVCDLLLRRSSGTPLQVSRVELLRDGIVVSSDIHQATAGSGAERYRLWAPGGGRQVLLRADVSGQRDADSSGQVWLQQMPMPTYTLLLNSDEVAGSNLALNKPVTAAETRYGAPANVTDGNTTNAGIWASREYPQSCRVDLEQQYPIDRLRLYLWRDGRSFYRYAISVSADGSEWTQVVDMSRNTLPSHISGDLHAFSGVTARYVRIDMLYNSNAPTVSVVELEVYGE